MENSFQVSYIGRFFWIFAFLGCITLGPSAYASHHDSHDNRESSSIVLPAELKSQFSASDFVIVQYQRSSDIGSDVSIQIIASTAPRVNAIILEKLRAHPCHLPVDGEVFRRRILLK